MPSMIPQIRGLPPVLDDINRRLEAVNGTQYVYSLYAQRRCVNVAAPYILTITGLYHQGNTNTYAYPPIEVLKRGANADEWFAAVHGQAYTYRYTNGQLEVTLLTDGDYLVNYYTGRVALEKAFDDSQSTTDGLAFMRMDDDHLQVRNNPKTSTVFTVNNNGDLELKSAPAANTLWTVDEQTEDVHPLVTEAVNHAFIKTDDTIKINNNPADDSVFRVNANNDLVLARRPQSNEIFVVDGDNLRVRD